jgi:hypothetical protein
MSRALRAGNGRLRPRNSTTGWPLTVTTKLPLPGFSWLISTAATWRGRCARRPASILAARVLNAPHDVHASIETRTDAAASFPGPKVAEEADATAAAAADEGPALAALLAGAALFVLLGAADAVAPALALTLAGGFLSSTAAAFAFAFAVEGFAALLFVALLAVAAAAAAGAAVSPPLPPDPPFPLGLLRVEIAMVPVASFSTKRGSNKRRTTRLGDRTLQERKEYNRSCVSLLDRLLTS